MMKRMRANCCKHPRIFKKFLFAICFWLTKTANNIWSVSAHFHGMVDHSVSSIATNHHKEIFYLGHTSSLSPS